MSVLSRSKISSVLSANILHVAESIEVVNSLKYFQVFVTLSLCFFAKTALLNWEGKISK